MRERCAADLVAAAASGSQAAWDELVDRYGALVWSVTRAHQLSAADAADVVQTVWLRLVENLGSLRSPGHVAGWLATTARRESVRALRMAGRELPVDRIDLDHRPPEPSPEAVVIEREQHALLWTALAQLSVRCQALLRALAEVPEASYAEVSQALSVPVGSIGPTRGRCLRQLRKALLDAVRLPVQSES